MKWFSNHRSQFLSLCENNGIGLDYSTNKSAFEVFRSIFGSREYADYFPFYEDAVIVDIGAHYGFFSMFASVNSGPSARVVALEPSTANQAIFRKNIFDAKIRNIELVEAALSDKPGEMPLFEGSSINHSLIDDYPLNESDAAATTVTVYSLQSLMEKYNLHRIDFLKLDCEGSEYDIVLNSDPHIFDKITTISMEFHDLRSNEKTGNALVKKLSAGLGYRIVKYQHDATNLGMNFGKIIATKLF